MFDVTRENNYKFLIRNLIKANAAFFVLYKALFLYSLGLYPILQVRLKIHSGKFVDIQISISDLAESGFLV